MLGKGKIYARIWLFVTLLLLTGAHYFFYLFSIDRLNTYPIARGLTFACVLWTTVLLGAMWLRHAWARYVMAGMICIAIILFSLLALLLRTGSIDPLSHLMRLVILGVLLYAFALIPLGASRSLRAYLGPRTAGER